MKRLCSRLGVVWCAAVLAFSTAAGRASAAPPASDTADSLVQRALRAEMEDQPKLRDACLQDVLSKSPDHAPAHWHSGHVRVGNQWLPVAEAEELMARSSAMAGYVRVREGSPDSAAGHKSLAAYCRKHGLPERERWHWANVSRHQPGNKDAIRALGLQKHHGRNLTADQITLFDEWERQNQQARERWQPVFERLRPALREGDSEGRRAAFKELQEIRDPQAIPYLAAELAAADEPTQLALVQALGNLQHQAATWILVRCALLPDSKAVRDAATESLKPRSPFGYVPALMACLQTPIEWNYYVQTLGPLTMIARFRVFREGPEVENTLWGERLYAPRFTRGGAIEWGRMQRLHEIWTRDVAADVARLAQANSQAENWNERVLSVLRRTTGQELNDEPQSWWEWWADYNDLPVYEHKPQAEEHYAVLYSLRPPGHSCFMPGTLVWTETGPIAIEKIRVGDRVLSQDPDSGELAYKFVLATTVRPPDPILRLVVDGAEIHTTTGHPFWRVGEGWRMAKELQVGDRLHTVSGAAKVERIEKYAKFIAYNLVVQDFATYFVGPPRLLVHDNTVRQVTPAAVPGLAADESADMASAPPGS